MPTAARFERVIRWVHYPKVVDSNLAHTTRQTEEGLVFRGPLREPLLEPNLLSLRIERRFFRCLLLLAPIELADGIRLHLPSLYRNGCLAFAFAELLS